MTNTLRRGISVLVTGSRCLVEVKASTLPQVLRQRQLQEQDAGPTTAAIILLVVFFTCGLGISCAALGAITEYHCTQEHRTRQEAFAQAVARAREHVNTAALPKPPSSTDADTRLRNTHNATAATTEDIFSSLPVQYTYEAPTDGCYGAIFYERGQRRGLLFDLAFAKPAQNEHPYAGYVVTGRVRHPTLPGATTTSSLEAAAGSTPTNAHAATTGTFRGKLIVTDGRVADNGEAYWILEDDSSAVHQQQLGQSRQSTTTSAYRRLLFWRPRPRQILVRASFDTTSRPRKLLGGTWHATGPETAVHGRFQTMTWLPPGRYNGTDDSDGDNATLQMDYDGGDEDGDFKDDDLEISRV